MPQPAAHGHHNPGTTGTGYLGVPGAGLDCRSPRRGDAITATGSLSSAAEAALRLRLFSDERYGVQ